MLIVIRVQPVLFARDPYSHLFNLCLNDQFTIFRTSSLAEQYIRKQQIFARQHFIMMAFSNFLRDALVQSDRDSFFSPLQEMRYYAPSSRQRGRRLAVRQDYSLSPDDQEFVRAQSLSMQHQQPRPSFSSRRTTEIAVKDELPKDFSLAPEIANQIKSNQYNDPITLENINNSGHVACVRLPNGIYNIYDKDSLFQHFKTNSPNGTTFTDPLSNLRVNIADVFSVPTVKVKSFANNPTPVSPQSGTSDQSTRTQARAGRRA